jgi:hypothetical protein
MLMKYQVVEAAPFPEDLVTSTVPVAGPSMLLCLPVPFVAGLEWARTKFAGKVACKEMYPWVTIIRPTQMFGAKVKFFTVMANFGAPRYPFIPLVDGGHCLTQPSSQRCQRGTSNHLHL